MAKTVTVEIRVADMPQFERLIGAVADLLRALGRCDSLPGAVMAAADQVRLAVTALGGQDVGPPPSGEDVIRRAMAEAQANPGHVGHG